MKFFIFILLNLSFVLLNAQNSLRLTNVNGIRFKAYVNDTLANESLQTELLITGIKKDTILVRIEFENKMTAVKKLYLLEKGKKVRNNEFDYLLEVENNKVNFNYAGNPTSVTLPSPLVPMKPAVDTSLKYKNNILEHYVEMKNHNPNYFNNIPKDGDCKVPMPTSYLNYMKILLSKAQTEDDAYKIALNTTRHNCINVAQMNVILSFIPFEIEKLKLIKSSFAAITDKKNKSKLDSSFKLESSKTELIAMLKNAPDDLKVSNNSCLKIASDVDMKEMNTKITRYNNDTERQNIFNSIYQNNCYSLEQVKQLLLLFIHDREKLDSAKLLYFYCVDQNSYQNLTKVFSYNDASVELQAFLEKQKK